MKAKKTAETWTNCQAESSLHILPNRLAISSPSRRLFGEPPTNNRVLYFECHVSGIEGPKDGDDGEGAVVEEEGEEEGDDDGGEENFGWLNTDFGGDISERLEVFDVLIHVVENGGEKSEDTISSHKYGFKILYQELTDEIRNILNAKINFQTGACCPP